MISLNEIDQISHCAFSDEASYNIGRFRAIGMLSLPMAAHENINLDIKRILKNSNISEFKWNKLKSARMYLGAVKLIDYFIDMAEKKISRLDILIWDTEDSRHKIKRRDDCANLARMYYHLYKDVLIKRWPSDSTWILLPDEHSSLDWETVKNCLKSREIKVIERSDLFKRFALQITKDFNIKEIQEVKSSVTPLIGIADLFAGMGVYSCLNFEKYKWWELQNSKQGSLFNVSTSIKLSSPDNHRCPLIKYIYNKCRKKKLGISLSQKFGLWTPNPKNPINFWHYKPQSHADKAPTKF
jgi:hypothetical protein